MNEHSPHPALVLRSGFAGRRHAVAMHRQVVAQPATICRAVAQLAYVETMESLKDKLCLVTGGTRGIGRAIAEMLLEEGARVAICGRSPDKVTQAVAEMAQNGNKVKGKVADVSSSQEVSELFQFIDAELGGLDVLVNNAGVGVFGALSTLTLEEWRRTVETNLFGVFYCSRLAVPRFGTRGGGSIVNINSLAGAHAFSGGAAYNASKFGLTGLSEAMMQDLRSENVRVSYVMPGSVATGFGGDGASEAGDRGAGWKIWPEDVAEIVRMVLRMPGRSLVSRVEVRPARPKR
jgi:NAD(P)-dependent dehydrogenase (short-subunit alcohol dehydrogenase family)